MDKMLHILERVVGEPATVVLSALNQEAQAFEVSGLDG
jgi:hypothetical protein